MSYIHKILPCQANGYDEHSKFNITFSNFQECKEGNFRIYISPKELTIPMKIRQLTQEDLAESKKRRLELNV